MPVSFFPFTRPLAIWFLSALILASACDDRTEERIREAVAAKKARQYKDAAAFCEQQLLTSANQTVDSMLMDEARRMGRDTLTPAMRTRPRVPTGGPALDTLQVKPLF